MSDYLARLAERLTAAEPAFVPRIPGRSEPDSPDDGAFFETSEERDGESARPVRPRWLPQPGPRAGSSPGAAAAAFFDPPPVPRGPAVAAVRPVAEPHASPAGAPARERLESRGEAAPPGAMPAPVSVPMLIEPQRADFQPPAAAGEQAAAAVHSFAGEAPPTAIASAARHTVTRVVAAPAAAAPDAAGPESASESSSLEISIGRIEIRPPAAPPRAATPSRRTPVLTLEKYIEQRRGGLR